MKNEYLVTNNGTKLYSEEDVIEYIKLVEANLSSIRSSFAFGEELYAHNLDRYLEIEQSLQLRDEKGNVLNNYDILQSLIQKNEKKEQQNHGK